MRDPYEVLGVSSDASTADLKRAYRKAALRWHPDRNPSDPTAEDRFKEIAAAWEQIASGQGPASRGPGDASFLDDVASAVERAQDWFEHAVLPAYAEAWGRGAEVELAARLVADMELVVDPTNPLPAIGWRGRRRARALLHRLDITLEDYPAHEATVLRIGRRWHLSVHPQTLWRMGFRERDELDDAVFQLITARLVQVVALQRLPQLPGAAAERLSAARALDDAAVRAAWRSAALRALLAAVGLAMVLVPWLSA